MRSDAERGVAAWRRPLKGMKRVEESGHRLPRPPEIKPSDVFNAPCLMSDVQLWVQTSVYHTCAVGTGAKPSQLALKNNCCGHFNDAPPVFHLRFSGTQHGSAMDVVMLGVFQHHLSL